MPVWRTLGKARVLTTARNLPKVILGTVAVVAVVLAMVFVPWTYKPRADGALEPVHRRDIYANEPGAIEALFVKEGDLVAPGDLLLRLKNHVRHQELAKIEGDVLSTQKQIDKYERQLAVRELPPDRESEMRGELMIAYSSLRGLKAQLEILRKQIQELEITSPIAGEVLTWDLLNRLNGRPVQIGQLLMEIADGSREWQLELRVPDDRIGHMVRAQNEIYAHLRERLRAATRNDPAVDKMPDDQLAPKLRELTGETVEDRLLVEYIVAGDPGAKHYGWIREVGRFAEVRDEEGNTVLVKVDIDRNDLSPEQLRKGVSVTARVVCGDRPLGYVLFHDLGAWAVKQWFRWF
jgi:multidrug efflux pump subunit AcrA (membrane-fusion protein)